MKRHLLTAGLALALAGCGGLEEATGLRDPFGTPQPFRGAGDQALVGGVMGERSVYIGPIVGLSPADEAALRKAIATNAEALDVLASADTAPVGCLTLSGTAKAGTITFALADGPKRIAQFAASGDAPLLAASAARSLAEALGREGSAPPNLPTGEPPGPADAAAVAPPLNAAPPSPAATLPKPAAPAAYLKPVTAADPKQAAILERAMAEALAATGIRMSAAPAPDAYAITGRLDLGKDVEGKTSVAIVWTVVSPKGDKLGDAKQDNTLPSQAVHDSWPEQAALAGEAAAQSVAQLIAADFNKR